MTAIVFGVLLADGHTDWPSRNLLMVALAEFVPVVMLERATASTKLLNWQKPRVEAAGDGLFVMRNALRCAHIDLRRRLARLCAAIDGRWFRSALREAGLGDYVLWLTVNDPSLAYGTPGSRLVYDCVDPNFLPNAQARFDRNEFRIACRARVSCSRPHTPSGSGWAR